MTATQSFILGMVQGMTEFLPISSSAHLILVPWFFRWDDPGLAFDVFLHLGTALGVITYFFRDVWVLLKAGIMSIVERRIGFERERILFWAIIIGTLPAAIAGLLFENFAEQHWRTPLLIAVSLASIGYILYWVDAQYPSLRRVEDIGIKEAVLIGIAQAFAIIPGVSRSGATITMGRYLNLTRESAARFSFLLSVPVIVAAGALKCRGLLEPSQGSLSTEHLLIGFLSSAFFGFLSIHALLRFVSAGNYAFFAWYRILLAAIVVFASAVFKI